MLRVLAVLVSFVFAACGGGSGGPKPQPPQPHVEQLSKELFHIDAGTIFANHELGWLLLSEEPQARFGDSAYYTQARGFLQFDISSVPPNAHVVEARLTVHRTTKLNNPDKLGGVVVDHILWPHGAPLQEPLAFGSSISIAFGMMTSPQLAIVNHPRSYSVDVTAQLADDVTNGRWTSAYRLYTPIWNDDNRIDLAYLEGWHEPSQRTWQARLSLRYEL